MDVMFNDFPAKFEELQRLLRERKENEMRERGKGECYNELLFTFFLSWKGNLISASFPSEML